MRRLAFCAAMAALLALQTPATHADDDDHHHEPDTDVRQLVINAVFTDPDVGELYIHGRRFRNGRSPVVRLGRIELHVVEHSARLIVAALPPGITAGNYLLSVDTGKGRKRFDSFSITLGAVGTVGEQGEPGPPGPRGERGPQGPKGDRGEQGERGEQGLPGIRGERGLQGERGERGETGLQGERGETGPQGERGPAGPAGDTSAPSVERVGSVRFAGIEGDETRDLFPDGFELFGLSVRAGVVIVGWPGSGLVIRRAELEDVTLRLRNTAQAGNLFDRMVRGVPIGSVVISLTDVQGQSVAAFLTLGDVIVSDIVAVPATSENVQLVDVTLNYSEFLLDVGSAQAMYNRETRSVSDCTLLDPVFVAGGGAGASGTIIPIDAVGFGFGRAIDTGTGASGRVTTQPVTMVAGLDESLLCVLVQLLRGAPVPVVTIERFVPGVPGESVATIVLNDAIYSAFELTAEFAGVAQVELAVDYTRIAVSQQAISDDGSTAERIEWEFSLPPQ